MPLGARDAIQEGMQLHARRDFDGAVRAYERALQIDPGNALAGYEITMSLWAKGDCKASLAAGERGLALNPEARLRAMLLQTMASCQDLQGNPKAANEAFDAAIAADGENFLIHFNRAVTLARQNQIEPARLGLERALTLNPRHASSHFTLSRVYEVNRDRAAALLSLLSFLSMEFGSQRAQAEIPRIERLMNALVAPGTDGKGNTVALNPDTLKRDPLLAAIELGMGLSAVNPATTAGEGDLPTPSMRRLQKITQIAGEIAVKHQADASDSAAVRLYLPFFAELQRLGHTQAFAFFVYSLGNANDPALVPWRNANTQALAEMVRWMVRYRPAMMMPQQQKPGQ